MITKIVSGATASNKLRATVDTDTQSVCLFFHEASITVPMDEFFRVVCEEVVSASPLCGDDDPREKFVRRVKSMQWTASWGKEKIKTTLK